ncbi:hypothetical protein SKAU_G00356990 [Synaphobranchus kaupii]|uniref:Uncharacterized protein n=1 Tax=Synaphobranchus kaupii TaxID=118154 RepID=A0A9Q1EHJ2_SYNKA|nr:hypothetical protein SKAU_G00356990 [Synaphobranchus kaupii]
MTTALPTAEVPVLMSFGGQLDGEVCRVTQRLSCPPGMSHSSHPPSGLALTRESEAADPASEREAIEEGMSSSSSMSHFRRVSSASKCDGVYSLSGHFYMAGNLTMQQLKRLGEWAWSSAGRRALTRERGLTGRSLGGPSASNELRTERGQR